MFRENPFHPSLRTHKLKGKYKNFYSYSVTRDYRVLFRFLNGDKVIFYDIGTHEIYK
jgi:proteic killer suppression protein